MQQIQHYVIVGDLVGSRHVPDREALRSQLESALHAIQVQHRGELGWSAPLMTTRGIDEVSGVLRAPDHLYDVATSLNLALWPQRFRFAVATGAIDIAPDTDVAADMDGPAFHRSAAGMQRARDEAIDFAIEFPDQPDAVCRAIEQLAHLHALGMADWTAKSADAVRAYRSLKNQAAVAKELGITQQAVSYALKRANEHDMERTETAIRAWLTSLRTTA